MYLTLINKGNRIPKGWLKRISLKAADNCFGEKFKLEKETLSHYLKLRDDLIRYEGIQIELDSAYRSIASQKDVYSYYLKKDGTEVTAQKVALPGFSEHNSGLAIDISIIVDGRELKEETDHVLRLKLFSIIHSHLSEFGFILRYPKGKESVTGYAYEPWHFRYVGLPYSAEMYEKGLTLEEYISIC